MKQKHGWYIMKAIKDKPLTIYEIIDIINNSGELLGGITISQTRMAIRELWLYGYIKKERIERYLLKYSVMKPINAQSDLKLNNF